MTRKPQLHKGRITAKQSDIDAVLAHPKPIKDVINLHRAADKAVDNIPRTPLARLSRGLRNNPAMKDLRAAINATLDGDAQG